MPRREGTAVVRVRCAREGRLPRVAGAVAAAGAAGLPLRRPRGRADLAAAPGLVPVGRRRAGHAGRVRPTSRPSPAGRLLLERRRASCGCDRAWHEFRIGGPPGQLVIGSMLDSRPGTTKRAPRHLAAAARRPPYCRGPGLRGWDACHQAQSRPPAAWPRRPGPERMQTRVGAKHTGL